MSYSERTLFRFIGYVIDWKRYLSACFSIFCTPAEGVYWLVADEKVAASWAKTPLVKDVFTQVLRNIIPRHFAHLRLF